LRLWLWWCWTYEILHIISAWLTSSLSNYLLWGCEIEVSDCPFEVHFMIYDNHKIWFHIFNIFTSVQQRVYWQPRYVTGTRCFLVCECTLILCGDCWHLIWGPYFWKCLCSLFIRNVLWVEKCAWYRLLVLCTIIIVEGQWS